MNARRGRETRRGVDHATRASHARETRSVDARSCRDRKSHSDSRRISRQTARGRGTAKVHATHFSRDRLFSEASRAFFGRAFDSREDRTTRRRSRTETPDARRANASSRDASRSGVFRRWRDPRGAEETRGGLQRVRRFPGVRPTVGSGEVLLQQHRVLDRRAGGGGGGGERGGDHVQVLRRHRELQVLLRRPRTGRAHRALRLRGIAGTKPTAFPKKSFKPISNFFSGGEPRAAAAFFVVAPLANES